ncbi:hypothetical protein BKI52_19425 [marine bacterium AO1-C]|nr:hypothetical protein BKI52_19425 [marine bacterium AO1-C]
MKVAQIALLLSVLFISSCKPKKSAENPTNLLVNWGVVTNFYQNKANFLAELKIVNQSEQTLNNNWELYFNYAPGRLIDTSLVAKEFEITHLNGDFYKLAPLSDYKPLPQGDTLTISIVATTWAIKESDAPGGFYFVFDGNEQALIKPTYTIQPFVTPKQLLRTSADHVAMPTPASVYAQNQRLSLLPVSELIPITPTPQSFTRGKGRFELSQTTQIVCSESLLNEAKQLQAGIRQFTGISLAISHKTDLKDSNIWLKLGKIDSTSERYTLNVTPSNIIIEAPSKKGIFYGIQSLKALFPIKKTASGQACQIPVVAVEDAPRFAYRGMHIDAARNFLSKQSILKLLDLMSFYKLNKLHFHLTDDEGWRIEIEGLPELTEVGARRMHTTDEKSGLIHQLGSASASTGSGYYTKADFIEILKFAKARHIEVIPEIDVPGHARAAIVAMKARQQKYLAQKNPAKANEYLLHDPGDRSVYRSVQNFNDNVICPCQSSSYRFLEKVITEIQRMYQEAGAPLVTIHTGGDEVPKGVWEKSPLCQSLMASEDKGLDDIAGLKNHFLTKLVKILSDKGLKTAGWEEIGLTLSNKDGKEKKVVNRQLLEKNLRPYVWNSVYGWGGEEVGYQLANAGYQVVLSNVTHLYFDLAYNKHPNEPGFYWGGFINDETPYMFQPLNWYQSLPYNLNGDSISTNKLAQFTRLTETGKRNILGIQGQLWSETVKTPQRFEYMLFPRLIALAERAWAPQPSWIKNQKLYIKNWNEFANRLGQRELLRLDQSFGEIHYRIPTPGAVIQNDTLKANISLPGLQIRYSTNGKAPTLASPLYTKPVVVKGKVILKVFNSVGRSGLSTTVQ